MSRSLEPSLWILIAGYFPDIKRQKNFWYVTTSMILGGWRRVHLHRSRSPFPIDQPCEIPTVTLLIRLVC